MFIDGDEGCVDRLGGCVCKGFAFVGEFIKLPVESWPKKGEFECKLDPDGVTQVIADERISLVFDCFVVLVRVTLELVELVS